MTDIGAAYLADALERFRKMKDTVERAMDQVRDDDLFASPSAEVNSIAIMMKHMSGNLRSRFTNFLTTDGEKPDRDRDGEFEIAAADDRSALKAQWDLGWQALFSALAHLTSTDLLRTVTIRGEPHSVIGAIDRQIAHQSYHAGQVVLLAKYYARDTWKTLSIPKRGSTEFTERMLKDTEAGSG
ncbi:MAG: DUF1572 family protein [Gemmatimonadaceae bacterium]